MSILEKLVKTIIVIAVTLIILNGFVYGGGMEAVNTYNNKLLNVIERKQGGKIKPEELFFRFMCFYIMFFVFDFPVNQECQ